MKKLLLSLGLVMAGLMTFGQVIFDVVSPSSIAGGYGFTSNGDGSSWGLADLNDPADAILDTVVIVDDGTPGLNPQGIPIANEGCDSIINNIQGKIALIYRNTCGFGVKAENAQNAGAIGVIIVNREPGLVNMNGGAEGANVTIPVTFVDNATGAAIRGAIDNGDVVTVFIGNKQGYYANDLAMRGGRYLLPRATAEFGPWVQTAAEYSAKMGVWIYNDGSANQTGVTVTAEVNKDGTNLFTETSQAFNLTSLDSVYITFADFSQPTYSNGTYEFSYNIDFAGDEFAGDNTFTTNVLINDNYYTVVETDADGKPANLQGIRPATFTSTYEMCLPIVNANASRALLKGVHFSASTDATDSLQGKIFDVTVSAWDDQFTDVTDPNLGLTAFTPITTEAYAYAGNYSDSLVYLEFANPIALADNQRYMICVTSYYTTVYFGFNDALDYSLNEETTGFQPVYFITVDGSWSSWASATYPAMTLEMELNDISVDENALTDVTPYPNPAVDYVNIPLNDFSSDVNFTLTDVTGKVVLSGAEYFSTEGSIVKMDVRSIESGIYFLNIQDGADSKSVRIIVNK